MNLDDKYSIVKLAERNEAMKKKEAIIHKNKGIRKPIKTGVLLALAGCFLVSCSGVSLFPKTSDYVIDDPGTKSEYLWEGPEYTEPPSRVNIDITEHYITNIGNTYNLFYIDSQGVLWGSGLNKHGQLGLGAPDEDFHAEPVKIAEDVIHMDYSSKDFVIYLTSDHELYGLGNAGTGALLQVSPYSHDAYHNDYRHTVCEPVLLMEDVIYARCGGDDVVAIREDNTAWAWGVLCYTTDYFFYYEEPVQILEDTELVTGGYFNHAALLGDGTVWTWGTNYAGNCGVADVTGVCTPQQVAENAVMVWTDNQSTDIDCTDITKLQNGDTKKVENTIIKKSDGTYWVCGIYAGNAERPLPIYHEVTDIRLICTHEFVQYNADDIYTKWGVAVE